jgi:hypothetical protein
LISSRLMNVRLLVLWETDELIIPGHGVAAGVVFDGLGSL